MTFGNLCARNAEVIGSGRTQRAFARHRQSRALFQAVRTADDDHLAHKAGIRQKLQALAGRAFVLSVPAPASPHDQRHQKQEPVACALGNQFINGIRHKGSSFLAKWKTPECFFRRAASRGEPPQRRGNTRVPLLYLNLCQVSSYSPLQNLHRGEAVQQGGWPGTNIT